MALKKVTTYTIKCQGLCRGPEVTITGHGALPPNWSELKIVPLKKDIGKKPEYLIATLCNVCSCKAVELLRNAGFTLELVNNDKEGK